MEHELKIETNWFNASTHKPEKTNRSGMPSKVFVAVVCKNGAKFIAMDAYDNHSESWLDNYQLEGKTVVAWAYPPTPSQFELFKDNVKNSRPV